MRWPTSTTSQVALRSLALVLLLGASAVLSLAVSDIRDGKLQSLSSAGIADATIDFPTQDGSTSSGSSSQRTLHLSSTSTLKLSFSTSPSTPAAAFAALILSLPKQQDTLSSALAAPIDPSQSNLFRRASKQVSSVTIPLTPRKGGKYRWEWDLAALGGGGSSGGAGGGAYKEEILSLARLSRGQLAASLLLAGSDSSAPAVTLDVGSVALDDAEYYSTPKQARWPREWETERFSPRPELGWTFREPAREIGSAKTLVGLVAVLAPWSVLLIAIPSILPSLSLAVNASTLAFFASLVALELATVSYWFGWITVWRFMPAVAGGATLALLTGKSALGAKMRARLEEERRTGKVLKMG